ncbi:MAG: hypothetical protein QOJ54_2704 [Aliidongia sp.]|nr:hypothetical protein [Aliidongia sp.]
MFRQLDAFCTWLQNTPFSQAIATTAWLIPVLQTVHILAIASAISSAFLLHLRLAGLTRGEENPDAMARRFLPFIWGALPVLLVTGGVLIVAEPARSLENPSFALKMLLLLGAVGLTAFYQRRLATPGYWRASAPRRVAGKLVAFLSLALWSGIVLAGRWIAYTQP